MVSPQAGAHGALSDLLLQDDTFIVDIPKVELHVHIEGTLTPEMRWHLAQRAGKPPPFGQSSVPPVESLDQLRRQYRAIGSNTEETIDGAQVKGIGFFEAYFSGFEVLKTTEDFYDLTIHYFRRASGMNVRYCEIFFDPQGHTSRGVAWDTMMDGFRMAQKKAAEELNVRSSFIACFNRTKSLESAMQHYPELLKHRDIVVGIGIASEEEDRPPSLFDQLFTQGRQDGFKVTAHCNVGAKNIHEHIRQVASTIAGSGADRLDHGINAADDEQLVDLLLSQNVPMTLVPCAYARHDGYADTAKRLKRLSDAGLKMCISSDDPPYVNDCWITHNIQTARAMCGWSDSDVANMVIGSVNMSWAEKDVKDGILSEIDVFLKQRTTQC